MIKRYVRVRVKDTGRCYSFNTIVKMYSKLGEGTVGVSRNALWNALSKGFGKYENNNVRIEYRERRKQIWK